MTGNTSNHHRYGEVKTRLTIGASGDFEVVFRRSNDHAVILARAAPKSGADQ